MTPNIDQILRKHTDEVKGHMDVLKEHFDSQVKLIAKQYESIIQRLSQHSERFNSIERNIEIIKVDIIFIKNSLKQKVDIEEFQTLEKRVAMLEAKSQI